VCDGRTGFQGDETSPLSEQAQDKGHDRHDHENEEQNFGDAHGTGSNSAKAEEGRNQRDNEKYNCVMQHFHLLRGGRCAGGLLGAMTSAPGIYFMQHLASQMPVPGARPCRRRSGDDVGQNAAPNPWWWPPIHDDAHTARWQGAEGARREINGRRTTQAAGWPVASKRTVSQHKRTCRSSTQMARHVLVPQQYREKGLSGLGHGRSFLRLRKRSLQR